MINIIEEYGLITLNRYVNPNKTTYTWRRRNPPKQSRLDYILISDTMVDLVDIMDIKPSDKSDHSSVYLKPYPGFVSGRYIGECTRLIYDIMSFAEKITFL